MEYKETNLLPPGCSEVESSTDSHKQYRCPKLGWSIEMELRRCSYQGRRYNLANHLKKNRHMFNIPRDQDLGFPEAFVAGNKIQNDEQLQHTIMKKLAILSGKLNISAKKSVSSEMEAFIHFLIDIGCQLHKNFPSNSLSPSDLFKMPNINKLIDYTKIAAAEIKEKALDTMKEKYINLEIDSGTVRNLNVVHFVISATEDDSIKPFLFKLERNTNFDHVDYYNYTNKVIQTLLDKNIFICSIIVDNLRSQTKGIELLKNTTDDPRIRSITIVHCFCHLISLAFSNTIKLCPHLDILITNIKAIVTILRKNTSVQFIGKKCPCIVENRWIYIYDVLKFILDNSDDISILLENDDIFKIDEFRQLFNLVLPLRLFVQKMESNNSICCVGKYLRDLFDYLKSADFQLISDIYETLYTVLLARFKSNNFDLIITSYFFSPPGRSHFREMNISSISNYDQNESFINYPLLFGDQLVYDEEPQNNDNIHLFLDTAISKLDSEITNWSFLESECDADNSFITESFKSNYSILAEKKFSERLNINLFENMHIISRDFVISLLSQIGFDYSFENIHDLIDKWAFNSTNELPFSVDIKTKKSVDLWKRIITYSDWKPLATAVIRIVSIGTSEANCERFISRQREVTGDHGTNYNPKSMESRLQILSASSTVMNKLKE